MKNILKSFSVVVFVMTLASFSLKKEDETPIIKLADPSIFYHRGTYYLYGTGENKLTNKGFVVYTSTDLKKWRGPAGTSNGYAFKKGNGFGSLHFWAPQVFMYKKKFYMAYTANENIAIAVSDSPLGPFRQENKKPVFSSTKNIDPFVFIDDDGKKYLYHVVVANGGNRIYVVEIDDTLTKIKPNTYTKCIEADKTWENVNHDEWSVTEGPTVIKKDNLYYLIYSANDFRSPDYAIGYAVSNNPLGPWKKYDGNPILSKLNTGANGSGHGDLFKDAKGNWQYVFHTHFADQEVFPRKTAIAMAKFEVGDKMKLTIDAANFYYLQLSKPAIGK